ncbi:WG repeat-containing protein [Winogradskyella sp. Asnod2-B02-A]|uniref:WG repeat-containing protein n=1 Tax=Winogradskyella sp. Asnod2-B02-A TaxID=3160583 RepID=UPI00386C73E7
MKKTVVLVLILIVLPIIGIAQSIENIDFISPLHNEVSAIKKDGKWAFVNQKGDLIIDFRTDLVAEENEDGTYPVFYNDRCKIVEVKAGISYFGFINKSGETVIDPQFLNTTNFKEGIAIALKVNKQVIGENTALDKEMVNHRYFEVLINTEGKDIYYLNQDGVNVVLDKDFLIGVPNIMSKYIAENLYAVKQKDNTWTLVKVKI